MAGEAGADDGDAGASEAGGGKGGSKGTTHEGGSAGIKAQAGEAGSTEEAGTGGMAGDSSVELELAIAEPNLAAGKTYVPFNAMLKASGATHYAWSITSGILPAGLDLQGTQAATLAIFGTPSEAGQFPLSLSVTDGAATKTVDVTLVVTHSTIFLSDRVKAGVNELFLADIGAQSAAAPVRLSASIPSGGNITSYAWSPDGSKVLYTATPSSGGPAELWVASLANPGTAQRVSPAGVAVSQMIWLAAGNIAAYLASTGDAYLVDLSSPTPGVSKKVLPASTDEPVRLVPSPTGTSLLVVLHPSNAIYRNYTYVSWAAGDPKVTPPFSGLTDPAQSYDGRYAWYVDGGIANWTDFSSASHSGGQLGWDVSGIWSPNAEALLYTNRADSNAPMKLFRGTFDTGGLTSTALVDTATCTSMVVSPWSPDAKNGVFTCDRDLRGINNVGSAAANSDVPLLPSGFLTNAFTNISGVGWSPNSAWLGLVLDREANNQNDLYLVRWSAPGIAHKAHASSAGQGVSTYSFGSNSKSVAFVGTIAPQSTSGLYLIKLPETGAPLPGSLVSTPATASVQNDINWLPGSRVVAYRAVVSGAPQLFAIPVAADGTTGSPISISGVSGSGVSSYQLAPAR